MQLRTFIISAGVHVAVGLGLMHAAEERKARKPTSVVMEDKKPEKKEKPPTPKPPPPPKASTPKPSAAPVASTSLPAPTPMIAPTAEPAVSGGIHLSNDGPGIPIGDAPKAAVQKAAAPKAVAAKPPPPTPSTPTECLEEATKPVPVVKPMPEYTDAARAAGVEGRLVVRIYVGPDGSVAKVEVVSSVDAALDAAALATIQKWRFTPSMKCGKPVDGGVYVFAQRFELAGD
jgi:protein TonB